MSAQKKKPGRSSQEQPGKSTAKPAAGKGQDVTGSAEPAVTPADSVDPGQQAEAEERAAAEATAERAASQAEAAEAATTEPPEPEADTGGLEGDSDEAQGDQNVSVVYRPSAEAQDAASSFESSSFAVHEDQSQDANAPAAPFEVEQPPAEYAEAIEQGLPGAWTPAGSVERPAPGAEQPAPYGQEPTPGTAAAGAGQAAEVADTKTDESTPASGPDAAGLDGPGRAEVLSTRRGHETGPEPAAALTADRLLAQERRAPIGGWRLWLYRATFGYVNVGDSERVRLQRALEHRIGLRLGERTRYIPVLSRKGGVGKTTVTTLLGMVLADIREDRVIAMDANPDRGTLTDRSPGRAGYTARQLVKDRFDIESFVQLSDYVAREGSRLDVLASDTDPAIAEAFDEVDYRAVTEILSRYYSIVLTDSGTGMVHSVMKGTLEKADTVVLVSGGSVDEARLASETLSWLQAHGREDLVAKAIVVINMSSGEGHLVDVGQIEEHFTSRVKTVIKIPYDRHLAEGSRIDLAKLQPATHLAVTELAALVIDELQG